MRINEFKEQKLDEVGRLAKMFGNTGAATLKQLGNRIMGRPEGELSIADKGHKEEFINNLFSAAFKSLNSEIAAGRVDPNIKSPSASPASAPAPAPAPAPAAAPQGQALDLDDYKKRREAEKAAALQSQQDAQAQIKQTAAANAASSAADNQLVARVRAEKQKPGYQQDKGLIRQAAVRGIHEKKYQKLNAIFENMLTEAESVEQWLKRFLPQYLRGIPINDTTTQALIKSAGNSYDPKNIKPFKNEMYKLANAVFATAQAPGYGAEEPAQPAQSGPSVSAQPSEPKPSTSTDASTEIINNLQNALTNLKGANPALYAEIIKKIASGQSLVAPTPTTESKIKKVKK